MKKFFRRLASRLGLKRSTKLPAGEAGTLSSQHPASEETQVEVVPAPPPEFVRVCAIQRELVQTELAYQSKLSAIRHQFVDRLYDAAQLAQSVPPSPKRSLARRFLSAIKTLRNRRKRQVEQEFVSIPIETISRAFPQAEDLHELHVELAERFQAAPDASGISEAFLSMQTRIVESYAAYAANFNSAAHLLAELKSNTPGFSSFLRSCEMRCPNRERLHSLRIAPIQRGMNFDC